MSTKNNPGPYDCHAKLEPDEPYFVLRGKDPIGSFMVNIWRAVRAGEGILAHQALQDAIEAFADSGKKPLPLISEKSTEAGRCAVEMREWAWRLIVRSQTEK